LLLRAEPLERAEEVSHMMVEVERLEDGALLLDVDPSWAGAINAVLVNKGVRVSELRRVERDRRSPR
jgi:methenyltetrahydromethanopterin cyclohydrolase